MHSIKFKLIFYFIVLIIFPVLITVSITNIKSNEIISKKIDESINNNIHQVKVSVDDILENSKYVLNVFILDNDFKKLLNRHMKVDSPYDFNRMLDVVDLLSKLVNNSVGIDSIYVYDINDNIIMTSSKSILENTDFQSSYIYTEAVKRGRTGQWIANSRTLPPFMASDNLVTYVMPIKIYEEDLTVGYAFINVNERTLYKYLDGVKFNGSGSMMIANGKDEIISYYDKNMLGKNKTPDFYYKSLSLRGIDKFPMKIDNGNTLVFMESSAVSGLYYFALVPVTNINREILTLRNIIMLVCILTVCFAILLSTFFSKSIYIPINRMVSAMGKLVFRPDFDYFIKEKRKDEFGILYNSFNEMVKGIKQLFEQLFQEKLKKKEAQLKFLQAQINPHFLYNTLNSIYCISKLHNVNEITELSYALTNFFRISFSGGLEFIKVREMLDQIGYYLRIQNIRYKDQFELTMDVDEELMDFPVLKFLLQPLVENSIVHGMKNIEGKGLIEITGYIVNDNIKFTVRDNGFGISQDGLEKIQNSLYQLSDEVESGNTFALRNIHRRIRLHYGEKYGIRIFSTEGEGTVVEVILPFTGKAGGENV